MPVPRRPTAPAPMMHPHDLTHPTPPAPASQAASAPHSTVAPGAVQHTLHSPNPEPMPGGGGASPAPAAQVVQLWQLQQSGQWAVVGGPMQLPPGVPANQQIVYGGVYSEFRPV